MYVIFLKTINKSRVHLTTDGVLKSTKYVISSNSINKLVFAMVKRFLCGTDDILKCSLD